MNEESFEKASSSLSKTNNVFKNAHCTIIVTISKTETYDYGIEFE